MSTHARSRWQGHYALRCKCARLITQEHLTASNYAQLQRVLHCELRGPACVRAIALKGATHPAEQCEAHRKFLGRFVPASSAER